jgi:hypothetical protein
MFMSLDDIVDNDDESVPPPSRPEKSRMAEYALNYLNKMNQDDEDDDYDQGVSASSSSTASSTTTTQGQRLDDIADATHLIAIPLDQAHELLIELESVQRAILYHCPILVDACIPPAAVRLPLLYVQSPQTQTASGSMNDASVTSTIGNVVQKLVDKHVFGTREEIEEQISKISSSEDYDHEDDDDNDDTEGGTEEDEDALGLNADGYRPLSLTFQSLEIDGDNNNVLQTVGLVQDYDANEDDEDDEDDDVYDDGIFGGDSSYRRTSRLHDFVSKLESELGSMGFKTAFPPDPQTEKLMSDNATPNADGEEDIYSRDGRANGNLFRPRVAFMELPKSFDEKLTRFKLSETEMTEEEMKFLASSDEGGNGISPIFWCRWWDDVFARNIRLREVGIYPRNPFQEEDGLILSTQFYLPYETVSLPDGNQNMKKSEKKFQDYQEQRMKEEQQKLQKEMGSSDATGEKKSSERQDIESAVDSDTSARPTEPDYLMTKTRKRLERIYLESEEGRLAEIDQIPNEETVVDDDSTLDGVKQQTDVNGSNDDSDDDDEPMLDDWKDRKVIQSDDDYMDDWMKEKIKKAINSLESVKSRNPIKKDKPPIKDNPILMAKEGTLNLKTETLEPPTQTLGPYPGRDHFVGIWRVVKSPTGFDVDDTSEDTSENIVLRVDGTTAGGPTFDIDTKQKAAGGTWKMLTDDDGAVRLRVRLVIPPKKERVMVMEGVVNRIGSQSTLPMPSRAFGVPHLEALAQDPTAAGDGNIQLISCAGDVRI